MFIVLIMRRGSVDLKCSVILKAEPLVMNVSRMSYLYNKLILRFAAVNVLLMCDIKAH